MIWGPDPLISRWYAPPDAIAQPKGSLLAETNSIPQIFDRTELQNRRSRLAEADNASDFLLKRTCLDILDRLSAVNREFGFGLVLGWDGGYLGSDLGGSLAVNGLIHTDLNAKLSMHLPQPALAANEEHLPFADNQFDLVLSPLTLQWVNDLPGTLAQIRRTLKPDGFFAAALTGGDTLEELRTSFLNAESEFSNGATPRVAPTADMQALGALLQRAGFALPVIDRDKVIVRYDTPLALMADLRSMGATNILRDRSKIPLKRSVLARVVEFYHHHFADPDGRVRATFDIIHISGWAPHPSQQKPLKPGSAKSRLADALGVEEVSLKHVDDDSS